MSTHARTIGLIVAAGRGTRASAHGAGPKQYVRLGDRTVLAHALQAFLDHAGIDRVVVAIHADDAAEYRAAVAAYAAHPKLLPPVIGGGAKGRRIVGGRITSSPKATVVRLPARPYGVG